VALPATSSPICDGAGGEAGLDHLAGVLLDAVGGRSRSRVDVDVGDDGDRFGALVEQADAVVGAVRQR
jgi:hypothetical protein